MTLDEFFEEIEKSKFIFERIDGYIRTTEGYYCPILAVAVEKNQALDCPYINGLAPEIGERLGLLQWQVHEIICASDGTNTCLDLRTRDKDDNIAKRLFKACKVGEIEMKGE